MQATELARASVRSIGSKRGGKINDAGFVVGMCVAGAKSKMARAQHDQMR
jgi:hypothetical protein